MQIKVLPIFFYGQLQGFKVYLDKNKFPKNKGEWYTTLEEKQAIKNAKLEWLKTNYCDVT